MTGGISGSQCATCAYSFIATCTADSTHIYYGDGSTAVFTVSASVYDDASCSVANAAGPFTCDVSKSLSGSGWNFATCLDGQLTVIYYTQYHSIGSVPSPSPATAIPTAAPPPPTPSPPTPSPPTPSPPTPSPPTPSPPTPSPPTPSPPTPSPPTPSPPTPSPPTPSPPTPSPPTPSPPTPSPPTPSPPTPSPPTPSPPTPSPPTPSPPTPSPPTPSPPTPSPPTPSPPTPSPPTPSPPTPSPPTPSPPTPSPPTPSPPTPSPPTPSPPTPSPPTPSPPTPSPPTPSPPTPSPPTPSPPTPSPPTPSPPTPSPPTPSPPTPSPPTPSPPTPSPPTPSPPTPSPPTPSPPTPSPPTPSPPTPSPPTPSPPTPSPPTPSPPTPSPPTPSPPTPSPPTPSPPTPSPPTPSPPTPSPPTPSPPTPSPPTPSPPTPSPPTPSPPTPSPPTPSPPTPSPPTPSPSTPSPPTPSPPTPSPLTPSPPTPAPLTVVPPTLVPLTTASPPTPSPPTPSPPTLSPPTPSPPTPSPPTPSPPTPSPPTPSPPTSSPLTPSPPTPSPPTPSPPTASPPTPSPPTPSPITLPPLTPYPATPSPLTPSPPTPLPLTSAPPTQAPATTSPLTPSPPTPSPPTPSPTPTPPSTSLPSTAMPSTPPPTPAPWTPAPSTTSPASPSPPTLSPPTPAPLTPAPLTPAPPTVSPPTPAPLTVSPLTPSPPTPAPDTPAPLTPAPLTPSPPTSSPPTPAPPTPFPVTEAPLTLVPLTLSPLTLSPPTRPPVTVPPLTFAPETVVPLTFSPLAVDTATPATMLPTSAPTAAPTHAPATAEPFILSSVAPTVAPTTPPSAAPDQPTFTPDRPDEVVLLEYEKEVTNTELAAGEVRVDAWLASGEELTAIVDAGDADVAVSVRAAEVLSSDLFTYTNVSSDRHAGGITIYVTSPSFVGSLRVKVTSTLPPAEGSCVITVREDLHPDTPSLSAVVPGLAALSMSAVVAGAPAVLVGSPQCGTSSSLPFLLHPTQWTLDGSEAFGALVGNVLIVCGLSAILCGAMLALKRVGLHAGLWQYIVYQGLSHLPSTVVFPFMLMYQGLSFAAVRLVAQHDGAMQTGSGIVGILLCTTIPLLLMWRTRTNIPWLAVYNHYPDKGAVHTFFFGRGEWVSAKTEVMYHAEYMLVLKPFALPQYSVVPYVVMFVVSVFSAQDTTDLDVCGHLRVVLAAAFACCAVCAVIFRPFCRPRDNAVLCLASLLISAALVFQAAAYYTVNLDRPECPVAQQLLQACLILIAVKAVVDVFCDIYSVATHRIRTIQEDAFGNIAPQEIDATQEHLDEEEVGSGGEHHTQGDSEAPYVAAEPHASLNASIRSALGVTTTSSGTKETMLPTLHPVSGPSHHPLVAEGRPEVSYTPPAVESDAEGTKSPKPKRRRHTFDAGNAKKLPPGEFEEPEEPLGADSTTPRAKAVRRRSLVGSVGKATPTSGSDAPEAGTPTPPTVSPRSRARRRSLAHRDSPIELPDEPQVEELLDATPKTVSPRARRRSLVHRDSPIELPEGSSLPPEEPQVEELLGATPTVSPRARRRSLKVSTTDPEEQISVTPPETPSPSAGQGLTSPRDDVAGSLQEEPQVEPLRVNTKSPRARRRSLVTAEPVDEQKLVTTPSPAPVKSLDGETTGTPRARRRSLVASVPPSVPLGAEVSAPTPPTRKVLGRGRLAQGGAPPPQPPGRASRTPSPTVEDDPAYVEV